MRFGWTRPAGPLLAGMLVALASGVIAAQPGVVAAQSGVVAAQPGVVAAQPDMVAAQPGMVAAQPVEMDLASTNLDSGDPAPPRYTTTLSVGLPMRVTRRVDFDQSLIAPLYTDAMLGYVFSSARRWRHGIGVGLSLNLTNDGGYTEPVDPAEQIVVMPSYLVHGDLDAAWLLLGHVGIPILASGGRSIGLEVGAGLGYRLLAGAGVYAEASVSGYTGGDSTLHVTTALELGVFVDYEVLP